jgi:hypothetical protein
VVALLDECEEAVRCGDRELELDLAALELAAHVEAGAREDVEHCTVLREHLGDEALDANLCCAQREPLQQPRADAAPLQLVCDCERRLRCGRVA